ncbi:peptidase catalytic [Fusarium heterosporum]|uniref:Peptidase catalytic n=1 Tax=Fusarium heterosporum TaxID=42747 RepID=A0A8H5TFX2_FUSHE|nr:peptidase catalytic [Fusarium heterosporum]
MHLSASFVTVAAILSSAECVSGSVLLPSRRADKPSNPAPLIATEYGTIYDVEVQFGNQSFMLLVDTGSSDTCVLQTGCQCINSSDNLALPRATCNYASTYDLPSTLQTERNKTFGVKYGTGIATGLVAYENLTMGGITVAKQTVGIVNSTNDIGDGLQSGLLGLAYPQLTSAHPGTNYPNDSLITNRSIYNPLMQSMSEQSLIEPWFSLALNRLSANVSTGDGGYMGLGKLPPVHHSEEWAVVPVEISESIPDFLYQNSKPVLTWWTLTVDAVTWGPAAASTNTSYALSTVLTSNTTTNSTAFQAVVDSGNPRNVLPKKLADQINGAFDPPAVYDEERDAFIVGCDARAPALGLVIGGKTFWHDQRDLIVWAKDGICTSSIGATQPALGIEVHFLGDAFLKNVVSVFDFGKNEMKYAARIYENNATDGGKGNGDPTLVTSEGQGLSVSRSTGYAALLAFLSFIIL